MTLREELIQVAAVAVAIVEDLDFGKAHIGGDSYHLDVVYEVIDERHRQDAKWGPQHHDIPVWLAILMEEVGEAAKAYLDKEGM